MYWFKLPDPGEGLVEAEIMQWLVRPGDQVQVNDLLVEIETAKSLVELPSPVAGKVVRMLVHEGFTVDVGTPIIEIDDGTTGPVEDAGPEQAPGGDQPNPEPQDAGESTTGDSDQDEAPKNLVGSGPAPEPTRRSTPAASPSQPSRVVTSPVGKVLAKPLVRRLARDLGVALDAIRPTGPNGTVSRADVETAAGLATSGSFEPIKGVRKVTAENLRDSVGRHVHVTEFTTIDVTKTVEFIAELKQRREFAGLHVSPLLLHAKAILLALAKHPILNAKWDGQAGRIVHPDSVNLGIAAATPRGLLVPNVRDADKLSLPELCQALNDLVATARAGKLQPADYAQGTFTITNVGVFGIDTGTPVINGDESAILAMGAINRRPWVCGSGDDERIEPRWVTTLALSFDHQLIDGEQGSKFLADVAMILTDPKMALLF